MDKAELKEEQGLCALPGCNKMKDTSVGGNKYCSRRHFYLHRFRQGHGGDEWQKAARCAVALLASECTVAEAKEEERPGDHPLTNTALVIFIFALLGLIFSSWMVEDVIFVFIRRLQNWFIMFDNEGMPENDIPMEVETSHGDLTNEAVNAAETSHGGSSADDGDDRMDVIEERDDGPELTERWMTLYEEVRAEPGQSKWRWTNEILWTPAVTAHMRGHVLQHVQPEVCREEFLKLTLRPDCRRTTDNEIRQWHRFLNAHFNLLMELHLDARDRERQLQEARLEQIGMSPPEDPHQLERLRFHEGLRCDRQQQTRTSYSPATNEMVHTMLDGAWRFVSCYEGRD